jgi:hypothetical protein
MSDETRPSDAELIKDGALVQKFRSTTGRHHWSRMTPGGKLVTWQTLVVVVTIVASSVTVAWRLDDKIDERVRPVAADVRAVGAATVSRAEFVEVQGELREGRETMARVREDIAAIRALLELHARSRSAR